MNEQKAIALCLTAQDPRGFEFLFCHFRKEAYYHAMVFLNNHDDAMDACSESFDKAFKGIVRLKELKAFYPWFYVILRNNCFKLLKSRNRNEYANMELVLLKSPAVEQNNESDLLVWQALQLLEVNSRIILAMKYIENKNYIEISETLSIPRGTVMSRLHYARREFKVKYLKLLEEQGG